jgi:hypothetical protein
MEYLATEGENVIITTFGQNLTVALRFVILFDVSRKQEMDSVWEIFVLF